MKKIFLGFAGIVLIFIALLFLGTGGKREDVFLRNYEISADGRKMKIEVVIGSSMGYVKTLKAKKDGNNQKITFYSTFGLNNKFGSKSEFEIVLNPSCEKIYFYNDGEFKLILEKRENGWVRVD